MGDKKPRTIGDWRGKNSPGDPAPKDYEEQSMKMFKKEDKDSSKNIEYTPMYQSKFNRKLLEDK